MIRTLLSLSLLACAVPSRAAPAAKAARGPADSAAEFLEVYGSLYSNLRRVSSEAEWASVTDVSPEHDAARVAAGKALAALTGDPALIAAARRLLARERELRPLQARELRVLLLEAAENPGTLPEAVSRRVEAEARQGSILNAFAFCLERSSGTPGSPEGCARPTTANGIDRLLVESRDLGERLRVWKASKETGPALKDGLSELRDLRNRVARHFGYSSFHALQVSDYGMSVREMDELLASFLRDLSPLYKDLHCWAKRELARRYGAPEPAALIPAHWLGNRWAQSWPGIVEAADLDPLFKGRSAEWTVKTAESFYVSLGFPRLPDSFWAKSDLYPVPPGSARRKNTHASAWHMDLGSDVRSLMSVEPDSRWFGTAHHELGHIYYYLSYTREDVPALLRRGANRAFHEAVGELIGMASSQEPYLRKAGILPAGRSVDRTQWLLNEALEESVAFLPWSAGTIASWERDLYELDLPTSSWNKTWWSYAAKFQGVAPPEPRGEDFCDACTKTHVNDDPAQYYDYAIATVLKYQLHEHICRKILRRDPHACDYSGSRAAGDFLRGILAEGARADWRALLREKTGSDLGTRAMASYFEPLSAYLREQNRGASCGF